MAQPQEILQKYWNYSSFRPLQEEIINAVLEGKDTLALLPTGGGKSICFQVPALCMEGLCIVISPLISLMKDQVEQLTRRKIPAAAIYSGMTKRELDIILDNAAYGAYKFLYVSPERLKTELFLERVKKMDISLLAVDEAHCISQWGYDFRPPYLEIRDFYDLLPDAKFIALTATATKEVKEDIIEKLGFEEPAVFQKSFARKNLSYSVFQLNNKFQKMIDILKSVPGSSVVYVRSRKRTREIAEQLWRNQIGAEFYHAGLSTADRSTKQQNWINGKIRVMVATNAFGMGIDKPDVRSVIHYEIPDTLEAYYQEAGRAGRDEKMAYAALVYDHGDVDFLRKRIQQSNVGPDLLKRVYQSISNHLKIAVGSHSMASFEIDINELVRVFDLPAAETFFALKKLQEEGLIQLNESNKQFSTLNIKISKGELYKFQVANANLDPIIKALLRLYGGELFTSFLRIKEGDLANVLGTDRKDVFNKLQYLHQSEVVVYDYPSQSPKLTFLTARQDANKLSLDLKGIERRNQNATDKMEAVLAFLENTNRCRTQQLQEYFDEVSYVNCGVCDYCLKQKKAQEVKEKVTAYKKEILAEQYKAQVEVDILMDELKVQDRFSFAEAMRELMESKEIRLEGTLIVYN